MGPHDAYEMLKLLKPRTVFGYAAGGADYIETSFSDEGSHEALKKLMSKSDVARPIDFVIGQPVTASLVRGLI